ncbi:MAG: mucoidy inhibitor MuiA family protein [Candidatus Zixiibacteriota bacterium]
MKLQMILLFVLLAISCFGISSQVSKVTVYPDRASVVRSASISIGSSGEHEFEIHGIPSNIDASSVRLTGKGTKDMKFGGIELERNYTPIDSGRIAEIEERLRIIQDELNALGQKRNALELEKEYLQGIGKLAASSTAAELKDGKVNPEAYDKTYQFLHESYMNIADMTVDFGISERKLQDEQRHLQKEMKNLGYNKDKGYIAKFPVISKSAGNATVELSYTVNNALWTSGYDVRYLPDDGEIELTYYGIVRQRTGESWNNAEVMLSTSRPSLGATYPRLNPWYLNIYQPPAPASRSGLAKSNARYEMADEAMTAAPQKMAEPEYDMASMQAEAVDIGGGSVQFRIPGKQTIDADNRANKLTISIEKFQSEKSYVTVPKLSQRAYLSAEFENSTDFPLLPGNVALFNGNNYIGKTSIGYIAPGEEIEMSLGVVEAIKVERELMKDFASKSGIFGGKKKRVFAYLTKIENNTSREIDISVYEQIPVPQNDQIEIDNIEILPEIDEDDIERGIFKWDSKIQAGESAEFQVKFIITYPKDLDISGI